MIQIITLGERVGTLTLEAVETIRGAQTLLLRTQKHPIASWLEKEGIEYQSLDGLYERAESFDALNRALAQAVLQSAPCVYAVQDALTDESVRLLLEKGEAVRILPGVSQLGQALSEAVLPAAGRGFVSVAASDMESLRLNAASPLIVTEIDNQLLASEAKLKLLKLYSPETKVFFRTASAHQWVELAEIDRQRKYDHTTCVLLPAQTLEARTRFTFEDLVDIMDRLRAPDGCPWDLEQTHRSLREYLLEEAAEAIEAIDNEDMEKLSDELGDVLLQVVFHACVDKQHGGFDIYDVTSAICQKMIHRHAHIFGDMVCENAEAVLKSWEAIKKKEKGLETQTALMRDIPRQLPALMRAAKVQKKARDVGFDWRDAAEAFPKIKEEAAEFLQALQDKDPKEHVEEELGDLLFAVVNVARLSGIQSELALTAATDKFIRRFERLEEAILADGKQMRQMSLEEMDVYWGKLKKKEG
ncbi:MAG TPA: nucleoside triphosphate pyrophosphohydrolase [Clostridia bacterium]|nr:nucleoside triphosphate pyrophosphohydrolase [Clostridia bacterium]